MSAEEAAHPIIVRAPHGCHRARGMVAGIGTFALVERQKIRRDRTQLVSRMVPPVLWLLIFGTTFSRVHAIDTGSVSYLDYLVPGIIAQSALFISSFYGIQVIWDRDAGMLAKLMATPTPASALVTGKVSAAGARAVPQAAAVLVLAYLIGVHLTMNPLRLLAAIVIVVLGAAFFACLSMTLAGLLRSRDRLMGINQIITMPLFFASNTLYPVQAMPAWLRGLSTVNPLSYEADALRTLLIGTRFNPLDIAVLVIAAVLGISAASALLRRLVR
ncbi:ABC transporter permease [Mycobacterium riyadhense]|uniref:Transport permease protein n=1 Tax=Mycobacterium riyadhense TaxID=486698 RepID=A0A653EX35_9MYCO|nr:ABC transporter permease [Mycobacterium riyadhense]VTP01501.1 Daunorubicin/doxorubicin resistance ABC transporter permease protein DrrB [Mycobacterium riyadhense]